MMRIPLVALCSALVLALALPAPTDAKRRRRPAKKATTKGPKVATIGVVLDGPWSRNTEAREVVEREVLALTKGEFDVRFDASKRIVGDWTVAGVQRANSKLLRDPQVDIIMTLGVLASADAMRRKSLTKPVLAPFVIDPELQNAPLENGRSGRKNLAYLTQMWSLRTGLKAFRDVIGFDRVVMLSAKPFIDGVPGLTRRTEVIGRKLAVDVTVIPVANSAKAAIAKIPSGITAAYVAPLLHLSKKEHRALIDGLNARRIASFSHLGRAEVEAGMLAAISPRSNFTRVGRRLALNVQRILLGEDPGTFTVALRAEEQLSINMSTARAIGQWPSWAVLTEAELIKSKSKAGSRQNLTLGAAMKAAMIRNVDLSAARESVKSKEQDVKSARANLLPSLGISSLARVIDKDRASSGLGNNPEFAWSGSAKLTQALWVEKAWAGYTARKHLLTSEKQSLATTQLDVARDAALAYLDILRAKSFERIRRANLRVTRKNLELARSRVSIGSANRAEVLRFESQIANDRKNAIAASAGRNAAEIALNRLLYRPVEHPFTTTETSLDDPALLTSRKELFQYLRDPWTFRVFREFLLEEAVANAPEIGRFDAAIAAQERSLKSEKRALWSPNVAVQGELGYRFAEAGEGTDAPQVPAGVGFSFSAPKRFSWSVGVTASLPLYSGGARYAAIRKAARELEKTRHQRESVKLRIAQGVASLVHAAGSSYAGIGLSREAAEAAGKNLDLVRDGYAKGAVQIAQLTDAQNFSLTASLVAASAVYDFLKDWLQVRRGCGQLDVFMDDAARAAFFKRAAAFLMKARKKNGY